MLDPITRYAYIVTCIYPLTLRNITDKTMATIKIKGMSCQHCVASTTQALEALPGSPRKAELEALQRSSQLPVPAELVLASGPPEGPSLEFA